MNLFLLQVGGVRGYFELMLPFYHRLPLPLRALWTSLPKWRKCAYGGVAILSCLSGTPSLAEENQNQKQTWGQWKPAQSAYDRGDYSDALRKLTEHPQDSAAYFYNLGAVYFQMSEIGLAVAYLEKANKIKPHDSDIQYNLGLARQTLAKRIGTPLLDRGSTWLEKLADHITLDEVKATLGLLGLIVVLLWTRAYLATRKLRGAILNPAGMLGLLGFTITVALYGAQRWAESTPPAACVEHQIVRSGPGDQYMELSQLEPGMKVRLMDGLAISEGSEQHSGRVIEGDPQTNSSSQTLGKQENSQRSENWRQIRYAQDAVGWVRSTSLLKL